MMQISNLRKRAIARFSTTVAFALLVISGLTWWMLTPPTLPAAPTSLNVNAKQPTERILLSMDAWSVDLWRPLTDAPAVVTTPEPPPKIRLFSLLIRDGAQVAALQIGTGTGLVYAKSGDTMGKLTVSSIDAKGVDLIYAGRPLRVEMGK
jgi:hypothetical protein